MSLWTSGQKSKPTCGSWRMSAILIPVTEHSNDEVEIGDSREDGTEERPADLDEEEDEACFNCVTNKSCERRYHIFLP